MPIDPNIIAGLRNAPPLQLPDPLDQYGKSLALKNLMRQGDASDRAEKRSASLQALLATNPDEAALRQGGFLEESLKVCKAGRDNAHLDAQTGELKAKTAKTEQEIEITRLEHGASILGTAKDQPSWEAARRMMILTFPKAAAHFPEQYDPQMVQAQIAGGLKKSQQLAAEATQQQQAETGRHNLAQEGTASATLAQTRLRDTNTNQRGVEANTRQREANAVAAATAGLRQRELENTSATKDATHEQAMSSYDTAIGTLDRMVGSLDKKPGEKDYKAPHPGFEAAVGSGFQKSIMPFIGPTPGTSRAGFMRELETFKAQTFLPMVQQLKGMGALSDAEGQKLSAAVGALSEDMPEKEFKNSVRLIKSDLLAAKERASKSRSKPGQPKGKIGGVLTQNEDGSFNYGF